MSDANETQRPAGAGFPWPPRRRDAGPVAEVAEISPEPFLGTWRNTLAHSAGISRLEIERRPAGPGIHSLGIRSLGGDGERIDWGTEVEFYVDIAPGRPIAFSVETAFGNGAGLLQGNLNLGLLVLGTYRSAGGSAGGVGAFSREFFVKVPAEPPPPLTALDGGARQMSVEKPANVDVDSLVGRWRNADDDTLGIAEIVIGRRTNSIVPTVEVLGSRSGSSPPCSWGPAQVGVYAAVDEGGRPTVSLLADYVTPRLISRLQLRWPSGTLAVAGFESFPRQVQPSYFTREFFYRAT